MGFNHRNLSPKTLKHRALKIIDIFVLHSLVLNTKLKLQTQQSKKIPHTDNTKSFLKIQKYFPKLLHVHEWASTMVGRCFSQV